LAELLDPLDPGHLADPYPGYRRLRTLDPVHRSERFACWILTRHADVLAVLRHPDVSVARENEDHISNTVFPAIRPDLRPLAEAFRRVLMFLDPPDHTRIRGLVSKAFSSAVVARYRPRIAETIDSLLADAEKRGGLDFIQDFAYPLPAIVIAGILGVPPEDRDVFKAWSDDLGALLDPMVSPELAARAQASAKEMYDFLQEIFRERRLRPRDDLVSALVAVEEHGEVLSESELFSACALLLGAGHQTTTNLLGNALWALLHNPEERDRLRARPDLIATGVEEFLRYDSPTQVTARRATADLDVGGSRIPSGDFVVLALAAANRDPEVFPDPDRLDLGRIPNRHLTFSAGIHYCMGVHLARCEAQMAIGTFLKRFPAFKQSGDATRKTGIVSRGLASLPLRL
jgi:cytochrome P450